MAAKEAFNLFDPHAHKRKTPKNEPAPPPLKTQRVEEMIAAIRHLQKDLGSSLDALLHKGGKTLETLSKLLLDKNNFTESEWQQIEAHKKQLSSTFKKAETLVKSEKKSRETKKVSQERKGKTLGARRRWIDMR